VSAYRLAVRVRARLFTAVIRRGFAAWGPHSVATPPFWTEGERGITVGAQGAGVWLGPGCWLNAIGGTIAIGDGCSFSGDATVLAAQSVIIGREVLFARGVHIGDHDHAWADPALPVKRQGIANVKPVVIGDGAWLGRNVTVTAGVSIGRGAVVAAGAVVTRDVPPHSLAAGVPARVIRSWDTVESVIHLQRPDLSPQLCGTGGQC
jgi:acetyltransferase-like isoleucine patch superfamily enzyme